MTRGRILPFRSVSDRVIGGPTGFPKDYQYLIPCQSDLVGGAVISCEVISKQSCAWPHHFAIHRPLRRLECVLAPTRDKVLTAEHPRRCLSWPAYKLLLNAAGQSFYNTAKAHPRQSRREADWR